MSEPMKCGGWAGSTVGCGAALRTERYGTDPPVDHDTMIRCLDCGTPLCRRCAKEHFAGHVQQVKDEAVVDALRTLEDEDHLQCEHRNREEPCGVCATCVARLKYRRAWGRVGKE
jgi:hypothetical protein